MHHNLPEKFHWESSFLFVFVFIFDYDNLATSSTLSSIGSDESCVVMLRNNLKRTLGQPLPKFQDKVLGIPRKYSAFEKIPIYLWKASVCQIYFVLHKYTIILMFSLLY